ncbi:MAG: VOC family protein [Nocardioidaceae bacterium]
MTALHHVQVSCPRGGEREVRAFYGLLLGLEEVDKPPELASRGGVWFRGTGYELHVGVEDPFSPARKAHPAFLVDDVDALGARLAQAGYGVTWDTSFPGYRRFHVADPHGNRVEILGVGPAT